MATSAWKMDLLPPSSSSSFPHSIMAQTPAPSGSQASSGSASRTTSRMIIPSTAPPGGLFYTQPASNNPSFFKIAESQIVTFGWNFTNIILTPTHLTVSAICDNGNTYPVGPTDGVIPGTATQVVWDPFSYQQANPQTPLAQASYTLTIWDDRGPTPPPEPGLFQPPPGLRFAMYTPQPYTPLNSGWVCPGCSGSISSAAASPLLVGLVATFVAMLISGWSLLRHR